MTDTGNGRVGRDQLADWCSWGHWSVCSGRCGEELRWCRRACLVRLAGCPPASRGQGLGWRRRACLVDPADCPLSSRSNNPCYEKLQIQDFQLRPCVNTTKPLRVPVFSERVGMSVAVSAALIAIVFLVAKTLHCLSKRTKSCCRRLYPNRDQSEESTPADRGNGGTQMSVSENTGPVYITITQAMVTGDSNFLRPGLNNNNPESWPALDSLRPGVINNNPDSRSDIDSLRPGVINNSESHSEGDMHLSPLHISPTLSNSAGHSRTTEGASELYLTSSNLNTPHEQTANPLGSSCVYTNPTSYIHPVLFTSDTVGAHVPSPQTERSLPLTPLTPPAGPALLRIASGNPSAPSNVTVGKFDSRSIPPGTPSPDIETSGDCNNESFNTVSVGASEASVHDVAAGTDWRTDAEGVASAAEGTVHMPPSYESLFPWFKRNQTL